MAGLALAGEAWITQAGCIALCPHGSLLFLGPVLGGACYSRGSDRSMQVIVLPHDVPVKEKSFPFS